MLTLKLCSACQVKAFKIAPFETTVLKPLRAQTERRAQECRGDYCRTLGMDDSIDAMNQASERPNRLCNGLSELFLP